MKHSVGILLFKLLLFVKHRILSTKNLASISKLPWKCTLNNKL